MNSAMRQQVADREAKGGDFAPVVDADRVHVTLRLPAGSMVDGQVPDGKANGLGVTITMPKDSWSDFRRAAIASFADMQAELEPAAPAPAAKPTGKGGHKD